MRLPVFLTYLPVLRTLTTKSAQVHTVSGLGGCVRPNFMPGYIKGYRERGESKTPKPFYNTSKVSNRPWIGRSPTHLYRARAVIGWYPPDQLFRFADYDPRHFPTPPLVRVTLHTHVYTLSGVGPHATPETE
jgi:hypothetical protein